MRLSSLLVSRIYPVAGSSSSAFTIQSVNSALLATTERRASLKVFDRLELLFCMLNGPIDDTKLSESDKFIDLRTEGSWLARFVSLGGGEKA